MYERRTWVLLLPLTACSLAEPPTCDDQEMFACFAGSFRGLLSERLSGVEVCAPDLTDLACVVSDEEGTWKLPGLPPDGDVLLTAQLDGAVDTVFPQHTSMAWYDWYKVMVPRTIMETNASNLGMALNPDKGHILFIAWEGLNLDGVDTPRVGGVTVQVGSGAGRVFYANLFGLASASETATTGNGSGGVLDLAPGVYELEVSSPAGLCTEQMFHWAQVRPGVIPVPVRAGFTTAIDILCPI